MAKRYGIDARSVRMQSKINCAVGTAAKAGPIWSAMTEVPESVGKSVPAVKRAASILWLLADQTEPLNLSQIAKGADVLPSTALHILRELSAARLVAIDTKQKMYRLGSGLIELAQGVLHRNDFAEVARPFLQDVAMRFDVTATATAALDADHNACVASISPSNGMSLSVTVGGRVPTLSGAAGRCIAAYSGTSLTDLRKRFAKVRWQEPLDFDTWLTQVEHVRSSGFAEDRGFFARGITTLAAPVLNADGSVTSAVGIATISATLDSERRRGIAEALQRAAQKIATEMEA